jgi:hypothetical protein
VLPGSLQPRLFGDFETLFAPELSTPLTLAPARHTDSDSILAPVLFRNFLFPRLVSDVDAIYQPARTSMWALYAPLVTDADSIYAFSTLETLFPGTLFDNDIEYPMLVSGGITTIAPPEHFDNDVISSPAIAIIATAFDSGLSVAATLSNNNLTATHNSTANNSGARSDAHRSTGRFYFEVTMTVTHGFNDSVGLVLSTGTYAEMVSNGVNCVITTKGGGTIYANNANSGKTLGACTSGDVIGVAVDLNIRKAWLRKNGGLWNGLPLASENPILGLGGVMFATAGDFAPAVGFGGAGTAINDSMTADFSGAGAPGDFGPWPATISFPAFLDGPATNVTVSNLGLTATHSTATSGSGVRSTALKTSGKYYFEATFGTTNGSNDCVAIMTAPATYANLVLSATGSVAVYATSNAPIYNGANSGKNLGSNILAGDIIGVAVDLDNARIWFRKNHGGVIGNWNGDALANPAINTNGVTIIATGAFSPALGFGGSAFPGHVGDNITINCSQSPPYAMTPPAGFGDWLT